MRIFFFLVFVTTSFAFYKNKNPFSSRAFRAISKKRSLTDSLPFLDTVIMLAHADNSNFSNRNLNQLEAEKCLYSYFRSKGIFTRERQNKLKTNNEQLIVDYDTIYRVRTAKFSGAVISYWLGPADLNGHCFQPRKAIIRHTLRGYKVTDENFIPISFSVDSVVTSNIYGYVYDCGGKGIVRHFKINLR